MTTETFNENPAKFGNRLKIAREAQHLTEKEAGLRLHLNADVITALEQENLQNGTPIVFLRGYLRSYARLLNFTEVDIDHALKQWASTASTTATSTPKIQKTPKTKVDRLHSNHPYMRWATHFIIFLLVSLVGMWWYSHSHSNNDRTDLAMPDESIPVTTTSAPQQAPVMAAPAQNTVTTPAPTAQQNTVTNTASPTPTPPSAPTIAAPTLNPPVNTAPTTTPAPQQKTDTDEMAVPEPGLED